MKHAWKIASMLALVLIASGALKTNSRAEPAIPTAVPIPHLRVFIIGNSFSQNATAPAEYSRHRVERPESVLLIYCHDKNFS